MKDTTFQKIMSRLSASEQDIQILLENAEKQSFTHGQIIVHEGETNSNLYIITHGVWRAYTFKDGSEVTLWFAIEGEIAFSTWGYAANTLSRLTLEAVTDGEAYSLGKNKLEQLYQSSVQLANLGRKILEKFMLEVEISWLDSYNRNAIERYVMLLQKQPEIIQSVPLKHIASYLGITAQSLSRIRAQLARLTSIE